MYNKRKKNPAWKNIRFLLLKIAFQMRNFLNEKFNPWMTTIKAFSPKIRALFSNS